MPLYDYICPENGKTVEANHPWSLRIQTWGELCELTGQPLGETPPDTKVERLVSSPTILKYQPVPEEDEEEETASQPTAENPPEPPPENRFHPIGCPCCFIPLNPGLMEFQRKMQKFMEEKNSE